MNFNCHLKSTSVQKKKVYSHQATKEHYPFCPHGKAQNGSYGFFCVLCSVWKPSFHLLSICITSVKRIGVEHSNLKKIVTKSVNESNELLSRFNDACLQVVDTRKEYSKSFYFKSVSYEAINAQKGMRCNTQIEELCLQEISEAKSKLYGFN